MNQTNNLALFKTSHNNAYILLNLHRALWNTEKNITTSNYCLYNKLRVIARTVDHFFLITKSRNKKVLISHII